MGRAGTDAHGFSRQRFIYLLHYFQIVGEKLRVRPLCVRPVCVLTHQFPINANVERAVTCGNQFKLRYAIAHPSQYFASHPDGAKCVPSILAIRNTDFYGLRTLGWIERSRQCVNHDKPPDIKCDFGTRHRIEMDGVYPAALVLVFPLDLVMSWQLTPRGCATQARSLTPNQERCQEPDGSFSYIVSSHISRIHSGW